jgi:tetratricopeptide (TPR) repeat protein
MREEISIDYITSKSPKKYKSEQARKFLEELKPSLEKYPNSYWLPLCANLISIHERMVVFDYINTAEVCRKAIQFFEAKPYETKLPIALFSHQLLVCLVMMKAYEEAEIVAQKAEKLVPNGSLNWFRGREQFLVLQFHCRRYEEAYETFQSVTRHQKFKSMAESEQEVWRIYGAYFEYFIMTGRISPNKKSTRRKFKLTKFLNEIPTFSKDKKGLNIPILLIQILFQLEAHHYDKVEDRLLALEKYATRHLNEEDASFRTACLVKMLRFMPQNGYNLKKLIPKTKNLLIRMSKVPVMIADQLHEIEAIPYEDYWKYATVSLEKK